MARDLAAWAEAPDDWMAGRSATSMPMTEPRVRVLIADDEGCIRDALVDLVNAHVDLEVVGVADDARNAVALARRAEPDVVLLDVKMPGGGGAAAARAIRDLNPNAGILVLSAYGDPLTVEEMIEAGATGYVLKGAPVQDILDAIHRTRDGLPTVSPQIEHIDLEDLEGFGDPRSA